MSHQQQTTSTSASTAMSPSSSSQLWPTIPQVWHRQRQQQRALTQLNDNRRAQDTTQKCMFFFFTPLIIFYKYSMLTDREHNTRETENYRRHWEFQPWWHPPPFPPQDGVLNVFYYLLWMTYSSSTQGHCFITHLASLPKEYQGWYKISTLTLPSQTPTPGQGVRVCQGYRSSNPCHYPLYPTLRPLGVSSIISLKNTFEADI